MDNARVIFWFWCMRSHFYELKTLLGLSLNASGPSHYWLTSKDVGDIDRYGASAHHKNKTWTGWTVVLICTVMYCNGIRRLHIRWKRHFKLYILYHMSVNCMTLKCRSPEQNCVCVMHFLTHQDGSASKSKVHPWYSILRRNVNSGDWGKTCQ